MIDWDEFSGVVRVFPLPAVSLLPSVVQGLHMFEERYRAMTDDAVAGDGLIAMSVLKPGWETDYAGRPPLESFACLGRITAHHRLADGRWNLLIAGVARVQLGDEVSPPIAYRRATAAPVEESTPIDAEHIGAKLIDRLRAKLPHTALVRGELAEVLAKELPLGVFTDVLGSALPLTPAVKFNLLAEPDCGERARMLMAGFDDLADAAWSPPGFSEN